MMPRLNWLRLWLPSAIAGSNCRFQGHFCSEAFEASAPDLVSRPILGSRSSINPKVTKRQITTMTNALTASSRSSHLTLVRRTGPRMRLGSCQVTRIPANPNPAESLKNSEYLRAGSAVSPREDNAPTVPYRLLQQLHISSLPSRVRSPEAPQLMASFELQRTCPCDR